MKPAKYYEAAFASELEQLATWRTTRHKPGTRGGRCAAKLAHATELAATSWVMGCLREPAEELCSLLLRAALSAGLSEGTARRVIDREWKRHTGERERERRGSLRVVSFEEMFPEFA